MTELRFKNKLCPPRLNLDRLVRFVIPLLLILAAACGGEQAKAPDAPWPSTTPEEQGMDSKQILLILNEIDARHSNVHSILILRNGALVLEAYYPPFGPQDRHLVFSATKSVTSALVGIAVQEGKIKSVDEPFSITTPAIPFCFPAFSKKRPE